jgi:hypothetical protein
MDLCAGSLAEALFPSPARLAAGSALGLAAILGHGLWIEQALGSRTRSFSLAHAFLQGTVAVALLRLCFSLVGICNPSWALACAGTLAAALWVALKRRWDGIALLPLAAVALGLPLALRQVSTGMEFGDLTAIWTLHAKALSCECALARRYVLEPCWAGTHPDYPLYLPFLHSFFFTLMGSFRDDWVKLWQALAFLAALAAVARSMGRSSALAGAAAVASLFAAAAAEHAALPFFEAFVELHSLIFAALIAAALLDGEEARLPLYLFGLAFTKHEGLMVVAVFLPVFMVFRRDRWRIPLATLGLCAPWLFALSRLPSRHENYPARLLDAQAWAQGLQGAREILSGCAERLAQFPWSPALLAAAVAGGFWTWQFARGKRDDARAPLVCLAVFALASAAFFATLLVSPWGPTLYRMTLERMLLHVYPLAVFPAIAAVARPGRAAAALLAATTAAALVAYAGRLMDEGRRWQLLSRQGRTGAGWYQRSEGWSRALRLDGLLPPDARGAVLNDSWYFHLNYMLYPRVLYPNPPEQVSGTWRQWHPWSEVSRADIERLQLSFVLDRTRLQRLR